MRTAGRTTGVFWTDGAARRCRPRVRRGGAAAFRRKHAAAFFQTADGVVNREVSLVLRLRASQRGPPPSNDGQRNHQDTDRCVFHRSIGEEDFEPGDMPRAIEKIIAVVVIDKPVQRPRGPVLIPMIGQRGIDIKAGVTAPLRVERGA